MLPEWLLENCNIITHALLQVESILTFDLIYVQLKSGLSYFKTW